MDANWDDVWKKKNVVSDYSLKLYDFLRDYSKKLNKNSKVLEIGCGCGDGLKQFRDNFVVGLDISEESLKLSKKNCNNLINADLFKLPFKKNSFDLVYSSGLLEHFKINKAKEAIFEIIRITKKGGEIIIIVPNSYCFWYRLFKKSMLFSGKWDFGYEEDYTIKKLKKLIEGSDLKIKGFFGLQALLPFATNNYEALPVSFRKIFIDIEKIIPLKQYYAYALGVILTKR
ncbi:MAG: class I SAM-dependent methyltransferase [Nanoarchaeota archaeon]|nr:class I SAM-dependent methyltransferase [Nanoarchaeota archaeon]